MPEDKTPSPIDWNTKLQRIDRLQEMINVCNLNLLGFDNEIGLYEYEKKIQYLSSLFTEMLDFLTIEEEETFINFRKDIKKYIEENNIFISFNNISFGGEIKCKRLNKKVWNKLEEQLFQFEMKIRKEIGKYFKGDSKDKKERKPM